MKSPDELRERLRKQWHNAAYREQRLLSPGPWPLRLPIGKPESVLVRDKPHQLRDHLQQWREVGEGTVNWQAVNYRHLGEAIELPLYWLLHSPSEWLAACQDPQLDHEYSHLKTIVTNISEMFHPLILRQRQQVLSRSAETVIQIARVAEQLTPGCARQKPLRSLSLAGSDSKFFERHRNLLLLMLEQRFGDEVTDRGLEDFLDALDENDHWLLVAPLDKNLLSFQQQRVRAKELMTAVLSAQNIILVENEKPLYQLPKINNTIAILGSGMNLSWLAAHWLGDKTVLYWGDIDTWGLLMLSRARAKLPQLIPLLMTQEIYDRYADSYAVAEPQTVGDSPPPNLSCEECALYHHLLHSEKGRLEQEFIPEWEVKAALINRLGISESEAQ